MELKHSINCPANTVGITDDDCTCGLFWRKKIQTLETELHTEIEMHNAWRKRAEEAETALARSSSHNLLKR
jgi:hypothetical protein